MTETDKNKQTNEQKKVNDKASSDSPTAKTGAPSVKPESDIAAKVGDVVRGDTEAAKEVYDKAKAVAGVAATKVYDQATEKASSVVDKQKSNLANDLSSIAQSMRQMNKNVPKEGDALGIANLTAGYGDTIADKIEQVSNYVDKKDLGEMLNDAERFAHRNPTLFIGGAFALGFLAARFLKSGGNVGAGRKLSDKSSSHSRKKLLNESDGVHLPENLDELSKSKGVGKDQSSAKTGDKTSANAATNK